MEERFYRIVATCRHPKTVLLTLAHARHLTITVRSTPPVFHVAIRGYFADRVLFHLDLRRAGLSSLPEQDLSETEEETIIETDTDDSTDADTLVSEYKHKIAEMQEAIVLSRERTEMMYEEIAALRQEANLKKVGGFTTVYGTTI